MSINRNDYEEYHESRESLCAPDHVDECHLCHEAEAERVIEFEGRETPVCIYCYDAIKGFEQGDIS